MGELQKKSVKELQDWARGLCDGIFNVECYGTHDLLEYEAILAELERRGIEAREVKSLEFRALKKTCDE